MRNVLSASVRRPNVNCRMCLRELGFNETEAQICKGKALVTISPIVEARLPRMGSKKEETP